MQRLYVLITLLNLMRLYETENKCYYQGLTKIKECSQKVINYRGISKEKA